MWGLLVLLLHYLVQKQVVLVADQLLVLAS
jgi:hypothetical protein